MMDVQPDGTAFTAVALPDVPLIQPDDDLVAVILASLQQADLALQHNDVLVIASKIVSKAEGRYVSLADVTPSTEAQAVATETRKDPRVVELVLRESRQISRKAPHVLVVEHRLGFISANAGIDQSNIDSADHDKPDGDTGRVLLLPTDPDASARDIRQRLRAVTGALTAVIISDTHGRPFRLGNVGVAIGVAGMRALVDLRGNVDLYGRPLAITMQGYADMVASAAHLLSGEGAEGRPLVLLRGLTLPQGDGQASDLYRPPEQDLYR
jgi:coenzyme F420-0:L-glutamate ligase / coenzyme F420-1:gamma-L-glutamate ligase